MFISQSKQPTTVHNKLINLQPSDSHSLHQLPVSQLCSGLLIEQVI